MEFEDINSDDGISNASTWYESAWPQPPNILYMWFVKVLLEWSETNFVFCFCFEASIPTMEFSTHTLCGLRPCHRIILIRRNFVTFIDCIFATVNRETLSL